MGFFSRLFGRTEERAALGDQYLSTVGTFRVGGGSDTGINVTEDMALTASTVWACIQVIANAVATLPLHVTKRIDGGRDYQHPVYRLMQEPNEFMTSPVFRECLMVNLLLYGNAYAIIERDELERPIALLPLQSDRTRPQRLNGQLVYQTRIGDGQQVTLAQGDVFHVLGMSFDGLSGLSPIQYARQTVGLSLATTRFASKFFSNSGNLGGIISTPPMSPEALKKFAKEWREKYVGLDNSLRVAVLPDGYKFTPTSTDPEKGQMLATRVHQVREICRVYKVAPHLVADIEKASYASLEVQQADFYQQTIQPWIVKIEAEANRKLFLEVERPTLELKFNMDAMLRATTRERYAAHAQATGGPFMTTNEARAKEGLSPIDGGDELLRPLNYGPTKPGTGGAAANPAARSLLEDTAKRYLMKEIRSVQRATKKHAGKPDEFRTWAADFYTRHRELVAGAVATPFSAAAIDAKPDEYATRHCDEHRAAACAAFDAGTIDDLMDSWEAMRPHDIAEALLNERAEK